MKANLEDIHAAMTALDGSMQAYRAACKADDLQGMYDAHLVAVRAADVVDELAENGEASRHVRQALTKASVAARATLAD